MINFQRQSGAALFVSLIMLLALTVLGLAASQRSNLQERMATNVHIDNLAFNSAESALSAVIREANAIVGDKDTNPDNIIFKARTNGKAGPYCFNSDGSRGDCGSIRIDFDRAGAIESRTTVEVESVCRALDCSGYSLDEGAGNKVGCRIFLIDGMGTVGGEFNAANTHTESSSLWAYKISACP